MFAQDEEDSDIYSSIINFKRGADKENIVLTAESKGKQL